VATIEQGLTSLEARYIDHDANYSQRISNLEAHRLDHMKDERDACVAALKSATAELAAWRPDMEGIVDDVKLWVEKVNSKCDRMVFDFAAQRWSSSVPSSCGSKVHRCQRRLAQWERAAMTPRDVGSVVVTTWTHVPTKGTCFPSPLSPDPPMFVFPPPPPPPHPNPCPPPRPFHLAPPPNPPGAIVAANPIAPPATDRLPKLSFPRFDGDNLHHWRSLCKEYFEMYSVPSSMWVHVTKQHQDKAAAR
jgi:hypothetical protein